MMKSNQNNFSESKSEEVCNEGVNMNETVEIIVGIGALVAVYILTRHFHSWRYSRAYVFIMDDLKKTRCCESCLRSGSPLRQQKLISHGVSGLSAESPGTSGHEANYRYYGNRAILSDCKARGSVDDSIMA